MAKQTLEVFIVLKVPSLDAPEAQVPIRTLARLLGRQMAREYIEARSREKNSADDVG
jgi:hypothetical protein